MPGRSRKASKDIAPRPKASRLSSRLHIRSRCGTTHWSLLLGWPAPAEKSSLAVSGCLRPLSFIGGCTAFLQARHSQCSRGLHSCPEPSRSWNYASRRRRPCQTQRCTELSSLSCILECLLCWCTPQLLRCFRQPFTSILNRAC